MDADYAQLVKIYGEPSEGRSVTALRIARDADVTVSLETLTRRTSPRLSWSARTSWPKSSPFWARVKLTHYPDVHVHVRSSQFFR